MAENIEPKKTKKPKSSLIGNQAKPTVLDSTTKLDIDTNKVLIDNIIEAGLNSTLDTSALERFTIQHYVKFGISFAVPLEIRYYRKRCSHVYS